MRMPKDLGELSILSQPTAQRSEGEREPITSSGSVLSALGQRTDFMKANPLQGYQTQSKVIPGLHAGIHPFPVEKGSTVPALYSAALHSFLSKLSDVGPGGSRECTEHTPS